MSRRVAALAAVAAAVVALGTAAFVFVDVFPRGVIVLLAILAAGVVGWHGLVRRARRGSSASPSPPCSSPAAAAVMLAGSDRWLLGVIVLAVAIGVGIARPGLQTAQSAAGGGTPDRPRRLRQPPLGRRRPPPAPASPRRRADADWRPSCSSPARISSSSSAPALGRGADAIAMAGGDGSQALVAAIAAEHGLPFVCIPAGTRNHFALDLGVDREDVVGALDALAPGARERVVDLAEVNGRTFVNNVSLGAYAEAVSHESYRESKLGTLLDSVGDNLGPDAHPTHLRWRDPDGVEQTSVALMLVTNNSYRLGPVLGAGTRPRLDSAARDRRLRRPGPAGPRTRATLAPARRRRARGPRRRSGAAGDRRRGRHPRLAPSLPLPTRRAQGPGRPRSPRRLAASSAPGGLLEGIRALASLAAGGSKDEPQQRRAAGVPLSDAARPDRPRLRSS